ncbi:RteC protein [Epilithonimonas mollis]|uniref:RteC protein n=1 Tax=Epilithonimonas mollis TaxID=216903 RepID=A0A1M6URS5_9FLAO|nr:RteC protein [Epilithonimonas mollis]
MVSKIFFKNVQKDYKDLLEVLERINQSEDNILLKAESCLLEIDAAIRKLKEQVRKHRFDSMADEVYFFKKLKPCFVAEFLFYHGILDLESGKPHRGKKFLYKYYMETVRKLESQYDDDRHFYNYYIRGASYLDQKYFVRYSYDLKMQLPQLLYSFDDQFTTSHDFNVARFMANEKLVAYINTQIEGLENQQIHQFVSKKLEWSSSKVNLVELIYAIHISRCFNSGTLELKETIRVFENLCNVDLHNFHKILTEIKYRKHNRTKFLNFLEKNLNQYFTDSDE